jgi:hypothetical protein
MVSLVPKTSDENVSPRYESILSLAPQVALYRGASRLRTVLESDGGPFGSGGCSGATRMV